MFPCLAATTLCLGNFYFSGSGSSSQGQGRTKLNCQEILPLDCRGKKDNVPGEAERVKRLKDVMLRNERFNKFAKSLRPDDWESRIKVILPLIEKHAKQIWPNCTVGLHGSVLREVHNEYGSDIDIAIHTNSSCSEREFLDLCHWLTKGEDFVPLSDSSEVGKAAKFLSHGLKVDVAIQERFGDASLYDSKFIEQLRQLYKSHPEVQEAARVAKFAFPELKGLDVEFLVCCLAERRLKLGQTVVSSSDFFLEICLELRNFPLMPSTSPLQHLLKNVRAQRGPAAEKDLREGLRKTQHFADVLLTELKKPSKPPGHDVKHVSRTPVSSILAAIVIFGYMAQPKRLHKLVSRIARARERPSVDIESEFSLWQIEPHQFRKDAMLRNERFNKFSKSPRPDDRESRIKVILRVIEKHAKQIWPNCTVGLHGSVLREVHNEYGSDIDIAIHTNSSCSEREFLDLCHWLTKGEDFVPLSDSSEVGKAALYIEQLGYRINQQKFKKQLRWPNSHFQS